MKKIIKLTENDLTKIVKRVIREERLNELGGMDDSHPIFGDKNLSDYSSDELDDMLRGRQSYSDSKSDEELENERGDFYESDKHAELRDDAAYILMEVGYDGEEVGEMDLSEMIEIIEDIYYSTNDKMLKSNTKTIIDGFFRY